METQSKLTGIFSNIYKLAELLTAVFFILLCLSVTVQVMARYFFNLAFSWGEELPIFLFLWVSFLAAAVAYRDGSHLSVDFIVAWFPKKVRFAIYYINLILSLGFVLTVGYYESLMTLSARHSTFVVMKVSKACCYVGIPVSCILFALFIIEQMMTKKPKLPEDDNGELKFPNPERP
ncbi:MAG: TRAP transporter small permease [Deltaproteobacteria bacterium]|nr:TRAP transporter small permease [Deltaproteobacteria bacterium]